MNIIIAGGGMVGATLSSLLCAENHDVTLVDMDQAVLDKSIETYDAIGVSRDYPWRRGRQNVPIWFYEGHAIWGMTGRIVMHLIEEA